MIFFSCLNVFEESSITCGLRGCFLALPALLHGAWVVLASCQSTVQISDIPCRLRKRPPVSDHSPGCLLTLTHLVLVWGLVWAEALFMGISRAGAGFPGCLF